MGCRHHIIPSAYQQAILVVPLICQYSALSLPQLLEDEGETLYICSVSKENEYQYKVMTHTKIQTHNECRKIHKRVMFMIELLHIYICINKHLIQSLVNTLRAILSIKNS